MAGRNYSFGYFSRVHATQDSTVVEVWEDYRGRQITVTAVFPQEEAARAYLKKWPDAVLSGHVYNRVQAGRRSMVGDNRIRARQNPANPQQRF